MSLRVNNLAIGGGTSGAFSITNTANASNDANATVYTFSGFSFGRPIRNRLIAVTIMARRQNEAFISATIGGVSADIAVQSTEGDNYKVIIVYAVVPTGSTGDVVVTFESNIRFCGISIYRITGQATDAPTVTDTDGGSGLASPTVDFSTGPDPGVAIYGFVNSRDNQGLGTWTNSVVEDLEESIDAELIASGHFGVGAVPDSAYQRDSNPGSDTWNTCAVAGAAWS